MAVLAGLGTGICVGCEIYLLIARIRGHAVARPPGVGSRPACRHEVIMVRIVVVMGLGFGVALFTRLYRSWRARLVTDQRDHPRVPAALRGNAERTWVVFTTPLCATYGPVEASLRANDPRARVVRVDATREPVLADAFRVRTAPTAVLADADGRVTERLVGAEAVQRWTSARA